MITAQAAAQAARIAAEEEARMAEKEEAALFGGETTDLQSRRYSEDENMYSTSYIFAVPHNIPPAKSAASKPNASIITYTCVEM